jgi:pimeloyl-ACP methyl ester carboxylesterase
MNPSVRKFFDLPQLLGYRRLDPLILVNGLAEQSESWFANRPFWSRHFDVKVPEILVYDGDSLHRRIDAGGEISVDYLADRLAHYLDEYVQRPPYHLVGSSLGGQVVLTYASRHPKKVARLVLLAPSGFHGVENLPVIEGVRRSDYEALVESVFHRKPFATENLIGAIEQKFQNRLWKKGVLRTLRGTLDHTVAPLLSTVSHPTLIIWGESDRIIMDVKGAIRAAQRIARVRQIVIPKCGHAPQIEKARLVNQLVLRFLRDRLKAVPPQLDPVRFLNKAERPGRPRLIMLKTH